MNIHHCSFPRMGQQVETITPVSLFSISSVPKQSGKNVQDLKRVGCRSICTEKILVASSGVNGKHPSIMIEDVQLEDGENLSRPILTKCSAILSLRITAAYIDLLSLNSG